MEIYTPEKGATLVDLEEDELPLQLKEKSIYHILDVNIIIYRKTIKEKEL